MPFGVAPILPGCRRVSEAVDAEADDADESAFERGEVVGQRECKVRGAVKWGHGTMKM